MVYMVAKKGFMHVTEVIIVVLLVFVILLQFSMIPKMQINWQRAKLMMMTYDLLYSLQEKGINWFDLNEVEGEITAVLASETMDFTLKTSQEVRPAIRVGCVCDPENFTILEREILTDFDLNGIRRSFTLERIDPGSLKFSPTNDVILFWGFQPVGTADYTNLIKYLNLGNGLLEFSSLTDAQAWEGWHQDMFNLEWSTSSYTPTTNAQFNQFLLTDRGYKIPKFFYKTPYELSPDSSTVGYWRMNTGEGGVARDTSGKGNNGELFDDNVSCMVEYNESYCPGWVEGKFESALRFDGDENYVYLGSPDFAFDQAGTIELWAKPVENSDSFISFSNPSTGVVDELRFGLYSNNRVQFVVYSDSNLISELRTPTDRFTLNEWHHFAVTSDGATTKVYVNGAEQSLSVVNGDNGGYWFGDLMTDANNLTIGGLRRSDSLIGFNGTMDEVIIYNRALSPSEILEHYTRKLDGATHKFTNFVSETVYPKDGAANKVVVEQETRYVGGSHDGLKVPLAVMNWAVQGKGRTAWMSSAPLSPDNNQLLKSLVIWVAGEKDYYVVSGELREGVETSLYTIYNSDMYEPVRIDLSVGYHY